METIVDYFILALIKSILKLVVSKVQFLVLLLYKACKPLRYQKNFVRDLTSIRILVLKDPDGVASQSYNVTIQTILVELVNHHNLILHVPSI